MDSLTGHLLVASPYLVDPNFVQTVVLLIHHSDEGAFGVVLNRPSEKTIQELWEEVNEGTCDNRQCLHLGGPVSGPLIAVHTDGSLAEMEIVPGLYFSAHRDHIAQLISQPNERFRLFVGHGRQRQPYRFTAPNPVSVEERKQERCVRRELRD